MAEHDNEEIIDLTDVIDEPESASPASQEAEMQDVSDASSVETGDFPPEQAIDPKDLEDEFEQLLNESAGSSDDEAGASGVSIDKDLDIESLFEEMEDDTLPDKGADDENDTPETSKTPDDLEVFAEAGKEEQPDDPDALFDKLVDTKASDTVKDESDQKDFDELLAKETAKTSEAEQDADLEELLASEQPAAPEEVPTPQEPATQEEPDPQPEPAPEPETPSVDEPEAEPEVEPATKPEEASLPEDKPVEDKPTEPEQPVAEAAPEEQIQEPEAPAEDLSAPVAPEEPAAQEPATQEPAVQEPAKQEPAVQEPATQEEPVAHVSPDLSADTEPQATAEETPPAPVPSVDTTLLEELKDRIAALEAKVQHPDEDKAFAMLTAFFQTSDQGKALIQEITGNVTRELQETVGQLVLEKVDALGLPLKVDLETLQENIQISLAKEIPGAAAKIIREEIEALTQK